MEKIALRARVISLPVRILDLEGEALEQINILQETF